MLALDDAALARICIAASRVHRGRRRRWLRDIAAKLDLPCAVIRSRERSRRKRARRRNGTRCYMLELPDEAVAAMLNAMVATERLTEAEASNHARVQAELGRMLCDWASHLRAYVHGHGSTPESEARAMFGEMTDTNHPTDDQPKAYEPEPKNLNAKPPRNTYDDPDLTPKEFLLAVMRSQHLPLSVRIKAAEAAMPYFTPRPGETRHYPCVDAHLTYIIPDNPRLREALAPRTPTQDQCIEDREHNGKSQSNSHSASNSHQPQLETPAPVNTETNSSPLTFDEIQEVKAAVQRLHPDADLSQLPDHLTLCECGYWVPFPCKCARIH